MSKKIILYGPSKIGISKFLSNIPAEDVLYIVPYPGSNMLQKRYLKACQSFTEDKDKLEIISNALQSIVKLEKLPFKYIVIEHLIAIETLISNLYMSIHKVNSMEYFAYNRGHQASFSTLQKMLYLLDEVAAKGITIFLTAHATKKEYHSIFIERAERDVIFSTLRLPEGSVHEHLKIWADALLYVNNTNLATGGFLTHAGIDESPKISIFTREQPNFDAGCRFNWPMNIDLDWNTFHATCLKEDK